MENAKKTMTEGLMLKARGWCSAFSGFGMKGMRSNGGQCAADFRRLATLTSRSRSSAASSSSSATSSASPEPPLSPSSPLLHRDLATSVPQVQRAHPVPRLEAHAAAAAVARRQLADALRVHDLLVGGELRHDARDAEARPIRIRISLIFPGLGTWHDVATTAPYRV